MAPAQKSPDLKPYDAPLLYSRSFQNLCRSSPALPWNTQNFTVAPKMKRVWPKNLKIPGVKSWNSWISFFSPEMTQGGIKKFCNMPRAIEKIYDLKRVFKKNLQKVNTDLQICRFAFYTKKSGYGGMKKFCPEIEKGQRFLVTPCFLRIKQKI